MATVRVKDSLSHIGPGIITGASDDDPSGILTYLQAGAVLGLSSLWTALFCLPLMYGVQEMCGRLGYVTGKGLMRLIKERLPKVLLYLVAFISAIVMTVNIGADLLAMAVVLEKLVGIGQWLWLLIVAAVVLTGTIYFSYPPLARVFKWLTLSLLCYVAVVFYLKIDWGEVLWRTVAPGFAWSKTSIMLLTAILGTTISPYLFFWQTDEEVEERQQLVARRALKRFVVTRHRLQVLREDTFTGMFFSNLVMWFIIVAAAQLGSLFGVHQISSFDQAALVLHPLLGNAAYLMFSLGLIGTGLLAVPVLAGSVGYVLAELFGWAEGMNKKFHEARGFYGVIIAATVGGLLLNWFHIDPVQLLIYTAVAYGVITPLLIFAILRLANDRTLLHHKVNSRWANFWGVLTLVVTSAAVVGYVWSWW